MQRSDFSTDPIGWGISCMGVIVVGVIVFVACAHPVPVPATQQAQPAPANQGLEWLGALAVAGLGLLGIERIVYRARKRWLALAQMRLVSLDRVDVQLIGGEWHPITDTPPVVYQPPIIKERLIPVTRYQSSIRHGSDSRQRRQMMQACRNFLELADSLGGFGKRAFNDVGISEAAYSIATYQLEALGALERVDPANPRAGWQRVDGMTTEQIMALPVWLTDFRVVSPPPPSLIGEIVNASTPASASQPAPADFRE